MLSYTKLERYADDTQCYKGCSSDDCEKLVLELNQNLDAIVEWSRKNGLILNPKKNNVMWLDSEQMIKKIFVLVTRLGLWWSALCLISV